MEGIVNASIYNPNAQRKRFVGAAIECSDGRVWVIDYEEQSPFHAFDGRQVVAFGEPYTPGGSHVIGWADGRTPGHFRVSTMRLAERAADAKLLEVGAGQHLRGWFERGVSETGDVTLSFVQDDGNAFFVVNDPAGATVGPTLEVWAYPVQPSPSIPRADEPYLWIISPYSAADLWDWRKRHW